MKIEKDIDVAIVGIACRFPGSNCPENFGKT